MNQPDTLKNALVRMRNGQGLRRVVRDDGANGVWISPPESPANMRQITRSEFDEKWEVVKAGDQQRVEDLSNVKYGRVGQPTEQVTMNRIQAINTPRIEVTEVEARKNEGFDGGRSEETDREAMKREILGSPVLDADFSGDPTAANEEPVSTFEPDRAASEADAEAAKAREEELSGQFETHDAPDDQLDGNGSDENADDGTDTPDEPTAGNEDPDAADEAREAAKAERKAQKDAEKAERKAAKGK